MGGNGIFMIFLYAFRPLDLTRHDPHGDRTGRGIDEESSDASRTMA
jgi:hypothetical protein